MYNTAEDLEKEYYVNFYTIYNSKNLVVKQLSSEIAIFYKNYILISYNRSPHEKRMFIYNMNDLDSTVASLVFEDSELALISFYIDYQKGHVAVSSELKIKEAFDKIFKLKAFL